MTSHWCHPDSHIVMSHLWYHIDTTKCYNWDITQWYLSYITNHKLTSQWCHQSLTSVTSHPVMSQGHHTELYMRCHGVTFLWHPCDTTECFFQVHSGIGQLSFCFVSSWSKDHAGSSFFINSGELCILLMFVSLNIVYKHFKTLFVQCLLTVTLVLCWKHDFKSDIHPSGPMSRCDISVTSLWYILYLWHGMFFNCS